MMDTPEPVERPRISVPTPRVTYTILAITVFIYLLQELTRMGILRDFFLAVDRAIVGEEIVQNLVRLGWGSDPLVILGGKINPLIEIGQVWRFLSPALLHADLLHIGFNMYALFVIGRVVEIYYGSLRYLILYLLGAFGGTVLSFIMSPAVSIGASGAIFGLVAAEAAFVWQNRALIGPQARGLLTNSVVIIALNFVLGLSSRGIDNWGHLGGLIAGGAFGLLAGPLYERQATSWGYRPIDVRSRVHVIIAAVVIAAAFAGLAWLGFRS